MKQSFKTGLILVVEDSPTQSIGLKVLLEHAGYRCMLASNGQTGLYLAQTLLPDVIILDIDMPLMNGFQVCEKLSEDETTAQIPVILLTRLPDAAVLTENKKLEVVKFIPKDAFAEAVLLETLRQMNLPRAATASAPTRPIPPRRTEG